MENKPVTNIYVGNLSHAVRELELEQLFRAHGFEPKTAKIMRHAGTPEYRGFGFVEIAGGMDEAREAIRMLSGVEVHSRPIVVGLAKYQGQQNSRADTGQ